MKLSASSSAIAVRRHRHRGRLVFLMAAAALVAPSLGAAQTETPGEPVLIPGTTIPGWGQVDTVPGRFGRPAGATAPKGPAVLILHGSGGVDGRGAFYATALQAAGIATLEITMFPPNDWPSAGQKATMPHAAAALRWLAAQPTVDGQRLGVLGFSWGGIMTVYLASELVQERLGQDVPAPAAFAPMYPCCTRLAYKAAIPNYPDPYYNVPTRMRAVPILIQVGTRDDYELYEELGDRPCDALIATWPPAVRELTTVRYIEGATHGFDGPVAKRFRDNAARANRGGMVNVVPSPKDAAEARQAVVSFFGKHLKP
jgi:dienelactone hydrolase